MSASFAGETGLEVNLGTIAYDGSHYVVVGRHGTVAWSDDALTWEADTIPDVDYLFTVIWDGQRFLAGGGGSKTVLLASADGVSWNEIELPDLDSEFGIVSIAYNGRVWVAVGGGQYIQSLNLVSTDGLEWCRVCQRSQWQLIC